MWERITLLSSTWARTELLRPTTGWKGRKMSWKCLTPRMLPRTRVIPLAHVLSAEATLSESSHGSMRMSAIALNRCRGALS